jgi:hypothetical protein
MLGVSGLGELFTAIRRLFVSSLYPGCPAAPLLANSRT